MAKIKGNKLLPLIVGGVIAAGIVVVVVSNKNKKTTEAASGSEIVEVADLSQEDLAVLGIAGDTEKDTVQTLITLVKTIKKDQSDTKDEIKKLKAENDQLKKGMGQQYRITLPNSNTNMNSDASETVKSEPSALEKQVSALSDKLSKLTSKLPTSSNNDNGSYNSVPIGKAQGAIGKGERVDNSVGVDDIVWVSPSDQIVVDNKNRASQGFTFPTSFNGEDPIRSKLKDHKENINQPLTDKNGKESAPVYTVPVNSTLTGSVSMTALLGRIPIDGVVSDPYPFKAVIGRDNLIANGIELPGVEGAIVSGTTSGDYVLSCVRGTVKSITFVFDDGRITTIPEQKNNNSNSSNNNSEIGWLSDEYGIPCISGEIKSNAAQYLSSVIGLGTAAAAADAMAQQNTTVVTDGGNVTNAVTGNNSQYVLGKGLSGGINQTIDWFNKRFGQTFDAVYVPPGQTIAIHITRELDIDYRYNGRLVDYDVNTRKLGVLD